MNQRHQVVFTFVLFVITVTFAVRNLYRHENGGFGRVIVSSAFEQYTPPGILIGYKKIQVPGFKYFNRDIGQFVNVHYNGFLSFGSNDMYDLPFRTLVTCPKPLAGNNKIQNADIIAVFWSCFYSGTVHSMPLARAHFGQVFKDLKTTFDSDEAQSLFLESNLNVVRRKIDNIKKGWVFTWNDMKTRNENNEINSYTFQAVLVEAENADNPQDPHNSLWFVQFYYESLSGNGGYYSDQLYHDGRNVCDHAQFGIGRSESDHGTFHDSNIFMPALPYFSNTYGFTDLGSWVWDLSQGTKEQPAVHHSICCTDEPHITKCQGIDCTGSNPGVTNVPLTIPTASSTENTKDIICIFMDNGEYPDPETCNHYYLCINFIATHITCPDGLVFKPTCENSGYCDLPDNVICVENGNRTVPGLTVFVTPPVPVLPVVLPFQLANITAP